MNEAIIAHHARQHKLITDSLGLTSIDELNEELYSDDSFHQFRVPVTLTRKGAVQILARDAESAEQVVKVATSLSDDIDNAIETQHIGRAEEV